MICKQDDAFFYYNDAGERVGPYYEMSKALDHLISHLSMSTTYNTDKRTLLDGVVTLYGQFRALEISIEEKEMEIDELKYELTEKQDTIDLLKTHLRGDNG